MIAVFACVEHNRLRLFVCVCVCAESVPHAIVRRFCALRAAHRTLSYRTVQNDEALSESRTRSPLCVHTKRLHIYLHTHTNIMLHEQSLCVCVIYIQMTRAQVEVYYVINSRFAISLRTRAALCSFCATVRAVVVLRAPCSG